ncbi:MAG: hypothetical protein Kow00109_29200 [Acidobacteriota bacterium]
MSRVGKWILVLLVTVGSTYRTGSAASQAEIRQLVDPSLSRSYGRPGGAFMLLVLRGRGNLDGLGKAPREAPDFSPAFPGALTRSLARAGGPVPAPFSEPPEILEWLAFEVPRFPLEEKESWRRYNPFTETKITLELTRWSPGGFSARLECSVKGRRLAKLELAGSLEAGTAQALGQKKHVVVVSLLPTHVLPLLQRSGSVEPSERHDLELPELLPTRQLPRLSGHLARKLGFGIPPETAKLVVVVTRKGEIDLEEACFLQCPHVELGREVLEKLQRWRFRPGRLGGIPRPVLLLVDFQFMVQ